MKEGTGFTRRMLAALAAAFMLGSIFTLGGQKIWSLWQDTPSVSPEMAAKISELEDLIDRYYLFDVDAGEAANAAASGLAGALDRYSVYRTPEEYEARLTASEAEATDSGAGGEDAEAPAPFQIAARDFTAAYNDAKAILGDFYSSNAGNDSGYESEAFDILMESAAAAVSPEARDAYLHDAEAILLNDAPVIPLYYAGLSWQLREGLSGLYRAPDGVFFLYHLSQEQAAA